MSETVEHQLKNVTLDNVLGVAELAIEQAVERGDLPLADPFKVMAGPYRHFGRVAAYGLDFSQIRGLFPFPPQKGEPAPRMVEVARLFDFVAAPGGGVRVVEYRDERTKEYPTLLKFQAELLTLLSAGKGRGEPVKRKRGRNIDTIPKVAKAGLILELKKRLISQRKACELAGTSPKTYRRYWDHPDVLEEMERLRQDKEYMDSLRSL
jgi:hypothetical protein